MGATVSNSFFNEFKTRHDVLDYLASGQFTLEDRPKVVNDACDRVFEIASEGKSHDPLVEAYSKMHPGPIMQIPDEPFVGIAKADLIKYALARMEIVEKENERIDAAFKRVSTSAQAQELYADTRESAGRQRELRNLLTSFDANMVIPFDHENVNGSSDPFSQ